MVGWFDGWIVRWLYCLMVLWLDGYTDVRPFLTTIKQSNHL